MTDLNFTEAIEAATPLVRAVLMGTGAVTLDQVNRHAPGLAKSIVAVAAPVIERQVRLLLAAEYANEMTLAWPPGTKPDTRQQGKFQAYENAARIARGSVNTDE